MAGYGPGHRVVRTFASKKDSNADRKGDAADRADGAVDPALAMRPISSRFVPTAKQRNQARTECLGIVDALVAVCLIENIDYM